MASDVKLTLAPNHGQAQQQEEAEAKAQACRTVSRWSKAAEVCSTGQSKEDQISNYRVSFTC
jgi:hypothetical protein